jgi:protein-histidine pros-kinase
MSEIADQISKGDLEVPAFDVSGKDEMATLAGSFNRMRRSLEKAMRMLEK